MRFLVAGIGSIGQRHYKNVQALGHSAAILRSGTGMRPFVRQFFDAQQAAGTELLVFTDLDTAIEKFRPDALIIGTPNHLHLDLALEGAKRGLHLLMEKPVHNNLKGLEALQEVVRERGVEVLVGYNLRFHPLLMRIKELKDSGELGEILSATVEVGENIADWHPWEDYRDTYAPYIQSGGGALLCFSHDIDYLAWLLGSPDAVYTAGGKVTQLEGDAEDLVQSLWSYANGLTALVHIDYFQRPKVRTLKLIGTKKTLIWDAYAALTLWDHDSSEKTVIEVPVGFERNDMFIEELKNFIGTIEGKERPRIPLDEAISTLAIVERMKAGLASRV